MREPFEEPKPGDNSTVAPTLAETGRPSSASLSLVVARSHRAPWMVRRIMAVWLGALDAPTAFIDEVLLVVSELVTNTVTHAGSGVRVGAEVLDGRLRLEVHDDSRQPPKPREPASSGGGYGLQFVAALTDDWGWSTTPTGKCVWIEHRFADPIAHDGINTS